MIPLYCLVVIDPIDASYDQMKRINLMMVRYVHFGSEGRFSLVVKALL